MNKIKVVISAIWYPMAMATYFWRAFQRREDIDLFVVGPFTGDWIPWNGGMRLPQKYVKAPDIQLSSDALRMRVSSGLVANSLPWNPDIWIQIDAGWHFCDRPVGNIVAHVQTDPHVLKDSYALPRSYSDLSFCMQASYIQSNEIFLPYAYDPTVHYSMPEVEKIYDACLIGLNYENRHALLSGLQSRNLSVRGGIGDIFDEFRMAYNQSRTALSWSSLLDVPARVFEAMGMKLPLVANRIPDMDIFFHEGEDYLGFSNVDVAIDCVLSLLADDKYREKIAEQGHETVQSHTWDARVEQILKEAKLL